MRLREPPTRSVGIRRLRDVGASEYLTPIIWRRKDGYLFSEEPADWIEYEKKQFKLVLGRLTRLITGTLDQQQHHLGAAGKWIVTADQASYRSAMQIVVTLDCLDTETQAGFWLAALVPLDYRRGFHGPPYLSLVGPAPAPTLLLQHVPEPKQGKNRMHLDLDFGTADLVSEVDRLEQLGAERLSEELSEHGFRWIVVADPEGNEFCVFNPPNSTAALQ